MAIMISPSFIGRQKTWWKELLPHTHLKKLWLNVRLESETMQSEPVTMVPYCGLQGPSLWNIDDLYAQKCKGIIGPSACLQGANKPTTDEFAIIKRDCPGVEHIRQEIKELRDEREKQKQREADKGIMDDMLTTSAELTSYLYRVVFKHLQKRSKVLPCGWTWSDVTDVMIFKDCKDPLFKEDQQLASQLQQEVGFVTCAVFVRQCSRRLSSYSPAHKHVFTFQIDQIVTAVFNISPQQWKEIVSVKRAKNAKFHAESDLVALHKHLEELLRTHFHEGDSFHKAGSLLLRVSKPYVNPA